MHLRICRSMAMPYSKIEVAHLAAIARAVKELLSDYDINSGVYRECQRSTLMTMCRRLEKFIVPNVCPAEIAGPTSAKV
jgi:hypothetical protein